MMMREILAAWKQEKVLTSWEIKTPILLMVTVPIMQSYSYWIIR